ncbi:hypothetical protein PCANC_26394 [Puccinia coronata f. sp. avenae]|uniref:Uncharacterized protein n=1 Tax=Puccinia coronata f. sp. avenae TaxID=200324 RepID=A0A2N5TNV5_9BASI|nr:hypothetical protein PCANC_26394 [Puccinia coronata f. sp. avenae]
MPITFSTSISDFGFARFAFGITNWLTSVTSSLPFCSHAPQRSAPGDYFHSYLGITLATQLTPTIFFQKVQHLFFQSSPACVNNPLCRLKIQIQSCIQAACPRPPSQTIVTNIGNAATCSSLTLSTSVYLLTNKLDDDGLDYLFFEKEDSGPDTLHTPEKTYERRGTCRYIFEDDRGFVMYSKRGWLNCASLVLIISTLLFVFVVWPVWRKVGNQRNRDPLSQFESDLTRQSGPFLSTDLPTRGST